MCVGSIPQYFHHFRKFYQVGYAILINYQTRNDQNQLNGKKCQYTLNAVRLNFTRRKFILRSCTLKKYVIGLHGNAGVLLVTFIFVPC